ncbi:MAG: class I SAM-dependent methyltransferase [Acidobacteriota bacterium]
MTQTLINCATCEVSDTQPFLRMGGLGPRHLVKCRQCGLIYTSPRPTMAKVNQFFTAGYIKDRRKLERELGSYRSLSLTREAGLVRQLRSGGRILDIGCAGGAFLANFEAGEWERHGVEPSPLAARAAEKNGIRVYEGLFADAAIDPELRFDVVTCLDVLCFSASPAEDLRRMRQLLTPDGYLIIDLPGYLYRVSRNIGPLCWLVNRRWSNFLDGSPHLYLFSPASLRRMLAATGFTIEAIHPEYAPMRGSIFSRTLNRLHYLASSLIMSLTNQRLLTAAKLVYVCRRT